MSIIERMRQRTAQAQAVTTPPKPIKAFSEEVHTDWRKQIAEIRQAQLRRQAS